MVELEQSLPLQHAGCRSHAVHKLAKSSTMLKKTQGPLCIIDLTEARAGLVPSPGWGPVRVGAHMGP